MPTGTTELERRFVTELVHAHFPNATLRVFGSRWRGDHKPFSDLDIAVDDGKPLDLALLGKLRQSLSASNLPYKVDIVDWNRIEKEFRDKIESGSTTWK